MAKQLFTPLEWDAHEYEHKERSADWFWAVGIIAVSLAIASVIFGDIIFGIFILVAVFALSVFINRPPQTVHILLDAQGLVRGHTRYPFESIHSFWIDDEHPHRKIILRSQKMLMPLIIVPLGDADADRVHAALRKVLPEEYLALPWLERALEYLGF